MEKIEVKFQRKGLTMEANKEEVAMAVKTYRLRNQLTQKQLAERWGCSRYTIIRLEAGKDMSWEMCYKVFARLSEELRKEGEV